MNEQILISGLPATPALWKSWEAGIGMEPGWQSRLRREHDEIVKLAAKLKAQAEQRELEYYQRNDNGT